jgi:carboxyl-terminal processing protease
VAGALQDYARAVIVGGEQTFGKGSVQATLPLSEYLGARVSLPVGGLALTVGKFYRVSGQSTQIQGVKPDIILPSTLDLPREGEAALVDPLPHDAIESLLMQQPVPMSPSILAKLRENSTNRIKQSAAFAAIIEERDSLCKERLLNRLSLSETERRTSLESAHRSYAERESGIAPPRSGTRFCRLLLEDTKLKRLKFSDEDPLASRDPESSTTENEALHILSDLVRLDSQKHINSLPADTQTQKEAVRE